MISLKAGREEKVEQRDSGMSKCHLHNGHVKAEKSPESWNPWEDEQKLRESHLRKYGKGRAWLQRGLSELLKNHAFLWNCIREELIAFASWALSLDFLCFPVGFLCCPGVCAPSVSPNASQRPLLKASISHEPLQFLYSFLFYLFLGFGLGCSFFWLLV